MMTMKITNLKEQKKMHNKTKTSVWKLQNLVVKQWNQIKITTKV